MESVKKKILEDLKTVSNTILTDNNDIEVSKPADPRWGDYSSNLPLKLAASIGKKPLDIAKELAPKLVDKAKNYTVTAAPNGFLNFTLTDDYLQKSVAQIVEKGKEFGKSQIGIGKKVQVEFISANPTGPLTLGNGRGGFAGDVLSQVLEFNSYQVEREYYINDVGNQIKVLGYSVARELGLVSQQLEDFYAGSYISQIAKDLEATLAKLEPTGDEKYYLQVGKLAAEVLLKDIQRVVSTKLNIDFDRYFSEATIYEQKLDQKYLKLLEDKGLAYEKEGAIWFKTTQFGDDKDRVLVRSDGEPTYLLSDVAHKNTFVGEFDKMILFLGADHHGYQGRIQAALRAFGHKDKLDIIIFQLVRLVQEGAEVKMSKRAGTYVALEDLVDEVGIDVARFFFLMNAYSTHMDFDLDLAKKKSNDNPVYYVQYAHARCASILEKFAETSGVAEYPTNAGPAGSHPTPTSSLAAAGARGRSPLPSPASLELLVHPAELTLIREMLVFPELVEELAVSYQVQQLPHYLIRLAEKLHRFYQECVVISEDKDLTAARIELVKAAKIVLQNGLALMGVSAPEKM